MPTSFKPEVITDSTDQWYGNNVKREMEAFDQLDAALTALIAAYGIDVVEAALEELGMDAYHA